VRILITSLILAFAPSALADKCPEAVTKCMAPGDAPNALLHIYTGTQSLKAAIKSDMTGGATGFRLFDTCRKAFEQAVGPQSGWLSYGIGEHPGPFRGCLIDKFTPFTPAADGSCTESLLKCVKGGEGPVLLQVNIATHTLSVAVPGDYKTGKPSQDFFKSCAKQFEASIGPSRDWVTNVRESNQSGFKGCKIEKRTQPSQ